MNTVAHRKEFARPIRVGIDYRPVTAAPWSGISRQVLALEQALLDCGAEVIRFTAGPLDHPHRAGAQCPAWASPVHGLHRPRERLRFELRFLPAAIRAQSPDFYIATVNAGLPFPRPCGTTRYLVLLHDVFQLTLGSQYTNFLKRGVYRAIDRLSIGYALSIAEAVWSPSEYTARAAAQLFPEYGDRIVVLPNAVPAAATSNGAAPPAGVPVRYWLAVGTREPRKNVPWFVAQWHAARMKDAAVPGLVLVGHPQDVQEELRKLPGLVFASDVDDTTLDALYRHAERLWQPSRAEGFGLPVIEALARGTPVAVATGSALEEIAPPSAPRFDPCDGAGLQNLMQDLARHPGSDADANRAWAARFALPAYTTRVRQLVDELLSRDVRA